MKIDINIYELLQTAVNNQISFEEMFFCYLIAFNKENGKSDLNDLFKRYYFNNRTVIDYHRILDLLEEAGLIENFNNEDAEQRLDKIVITEEGYIKLFGARLTLDKAWSDVLRVYPQYLDIDGKKIPARTISNEKVKQYYFNKVIGGNNHKHQEFISLTLEFYGCDQKNPHLIDKQAIATSGLEKYIYSWEAMRDTILSKINEKPNRIVRGIG